MKGGYQLIDCTGIDLTKTTFQSLPGVWVKAKTAVESGKLLVGVGCIYGTGVNVSPVPCFAWYLSEHEIVIVGATLHIHVKDDNTYKVLDVVA